METQNKTKFLTRKEMATALVIGSATVPMFAHADFQLDTSPIMNAIGVTLAAVTSVALAAVAIPLVIKGVKYLRAAF